MRFCSKREKPCFHGHCVRLLGCHKQMPGESLQGNSELEDDSRGSWGLEGIRFSFAISTHTFNLHKIIQLVSGRGGILEDSSLVRESLIPSTCREVMAGE